MNNIQDFFRRVEYVYIFLDVTSESGFKITLSKAEMECIVSHFILRIMSGQWLAENLCFNA